MPKHSKIISKVEVNFSNYYFYYSRTFTDNDVLTRYKFQRDFY